MFIASINYQEQLLWQSKGFSPGLIKCRVNSKALHKDWLPACPAFTVNRWCQLLSNNTQKPVATQLLFLELDSRCFSLIDTFDLASFYCQ